MRTYLFFAVLFGMFVLTLTVAIRPDIVKNDFERATAPIVEALNKRQAEALRLAKEKDWAAWEKGIRLPADCANPRTAIRQLECKNILQLETENFERNWANKLRSGWKPSIMF